MTAKIICRGFYSLNVGEIEIFKDGGTGGQPYCFRNFKNFIIQAIIEKEMDKSLSLRGSRHENLSPF